jgi:hypothetical protein
MRFFELLNFQHVMGYLFAGLLFLVLFWAGLAARHFRGKVADHRQDMLTDHRDLIQETDPPYPLLFILIIAGAVLWGFFYILMHGLLGVKI